MATSGELKTHSIKVSCGKKCFIVDVPTHLGVEAAKRRALYSIVARYGWPLEKTKVEEHHDDAPR